MKQFLVKCDVCEAVAKLKYNGEHYLAPAGWYQLYDDEKSDPIDFFICPKCKMNRLKPEEKEDKRASAE